VLIQYPIHHLPKRLKTPHGDKFLVFHRILGNEVRLQHGDTVERTLIIYFDDPLH
jgi:hypothetical protein